MKKFSDFSDEVILDGKKLTISDILDEEVLILNFRIKTSKHNTGKCLTIQIEREGKHYVLFTGSEVLIDQINKYKSNLPFMATIRKINKYYTFT